MVRLVLLLVLAAAPSLRAQPAPEVVRDCPTCPDMVRIKAGSFTMGIPVAETKRLNNDLPPGDDHARPLHRVTFAHDFWLGRYDVTRGEFAEFADTTNYEAKGQCFGFFTSAPAKSWRDPGFPQTDRDPVVCVNIADARAYTEWLSTKTGKTYRLPSEPEWEYAARAGTTTTYYWGNSAAEICRQANVADQALDKAWGVAVAIAKCNDGFVFTSPVGSFPANPWGLHDMAGNVWQWTDDCDGPDYRGTSTDGSARNGSGANCRHIVRGGSWYSATRDERSGFRFDIGAEERFVNAGFRVARNN